MAFIDYVLATPSYGWQNEKGEVAVPTTRQLLHQASLNLNVFKDRRNWISAMFPIMILCMMPLFLLFVFQYFSIPLLVVFIIYAMIGMGTHGTIWYHRFCTHKSYSFNHPFWRILTQNLVIKTIPEEIYVLSHHVHHSKSDLPGDPYNARGGLGYCMLAPINHQSINRNLDEKDYARACNFLRQTGVQMNSYEQYRKWGSVATPWYTFGSMFLNWALWYTIFFLIGGHGLACALFGASMFWVALIPAFNFTGHGKGEEKHVNGLDFDRSNLSVNQWRPGFFAGEWHNNHHLYPASARSGFLPWQLDIPWIYINALYKIGAVSSFRDAKKDFFRKYIHNNQEPLPTSAAAQKERT